MIAFALPQTLQNDRFISEQASLPFTYAPVGGTQQARHVPFYNNDSLRVTIGHGETDFAKAREAIRRWRMFPARWTCLLPGNSPVRENVPVAMYARVLGFWWRNACRIVYTVDEPGRYGFAYGTLPGHVECGEELFCVGIEPDGMVWYELRAFSRPRHWLVWLGYPFARYLQAKFRRDSARQMRAFVQQKAFAP